MGCGPTVRSNAGASTAFGQTRVPDGAFSSVSAGGWHSCGLRPDGSVECWGDNEVGQVDAPDGAFSSVSAGGLTFVWVAARRFGRMLGPQRSRAGRRF